MFNSYEFVWNNVSSAQFGLVICDLDGKGQNNVSFGNIPSIVETRTTGRIQPIHHGVNYHSEPLKFKLVFGVHPNRILDNHPLNNYEMQDVSSWLTGQQDYGWLQICQWDRLDYQYHCMIGPLTPVNIGWVPLAYEADVVCDCPYAYGFPFERKFTINGPTNILFHNSSTIWEYFKPDIQFTPTSGTTSLSIINHDDNDREFYINEFTNSCRINVNNNAGILQDMALGTNLYRGFNMNFFRMVRGDNHLTVTGNGTLTISGRFLFNVAA